MKNGRSISWRIRFSGSIEAESGTFPFAMAVKTKYQSVQGVTKNIRKPNLISGDLLRKIAAKIKPKNGVQIKFKAREDRVNLRLTKPFRKSLKGIVKKIPINSKVRAGSTRKP
jgi:hypothetical protein